MLPAHHTSQSFQRSLQSGLRLWSGEAVGDRTWLALALNGPPLLGDQPAHSGVGFPKPDFISPCPIPCPIPFPRQPAPLLEPRRCPDISGPPAATAALEEERVPSEQWRRAPCPRVGDHKGGENEAERRQREERGEVQAKDRPVFKKTRFKRGLFRQEGAIDKKYRMQRLAFAINGIDLFKIETMGRGTVNGAEVEKKMYFQSFKTQEEAAATSNKKN